MDAIEVAQFLSRVRGFDQLDAEDLERLVARLQTADFAAGTKLMRRGDAGDAMHVIFDGEVRVPVVDAEGKVRVVAVLGPGDVVGEMALLTGDTRRADVIAEGDVTTLVFERDVLVPVLADHPPVARFLTEILGQRLEDAGGIQEVGKYRFVRKIGQGATARVYEALHPGLDRTVAVKMLGHELVYDAGFRDRFMTEARILAALNHPNIVQVFDTEEAYATVFLVMERLSGVDLKQHLKECGVLDGDETMAILRQVAAGLAHAAEHGIVHRDVKPSNVSIDDSGAVKLMDFGIARRARKDDGERTDVIEGTPRYLAPETIQGVAPDHRADVYSLAVMAFEMVTGLPLFTASSFEGMVVAHVFEDPPSLREMRSDLPDGLVRFVEGGLIKERDRRLSDWDEIQELLGGSGAGGALRVPELEEQIIRVRYRPEHRSRVQRAVDSLRQSVEGLQQADVASATFEGAGGSVEEEGRGSLKGWLFGRGRRSASDENTSSETRTRE